MTEKIEMAAAPSDSRFMELLGRCITDWAKIEEQLFYACHDILGVTQEQCAIIFYRTPTLETRMQLVDELVHDAFPKPEKRDGGHLPAEVKNWEKLLRDVREQLPIRNQLAHQPVGWGIWGWTDAAGNVEGEVEVLTHSYPPQSELARGRSEKKEPLTERDLERYLPKVLSLYNRVNEFRQGPLRVRLAERLHPARQGLTKT